MEPNSNLLPLGPAYDYRTQRWISEPDQANALHRDHINQQITLLSGRNGEEYARCIGLTTTPAVAVAELREQLASLPAESRTLFERLNQITGAVPESEPVEVIPGHFVSLVNGEVVG